jgi:hypothetical protein
MWKPLLFCALLFSEVPARANALPAFQSGKPEAPAKPDKRPEVAEKLAKLQTLIGDRKGEKDTDAIGVIDQLVQDFPNNGPKDRSAVTSALSKCFEERRMVKEGDPPNNKLSMAAAVALSTMAPESTKELLKWIGQKDLKKDQALQTRLVDSLGKTKDKEALKPLQLWLNSKDDWMVSAAARAHGAQDGLRNHPQVPDRGQEPDRHHAQRHRRERALRSDRGSDDHGPAEALQARRTRPERVAALVEQEQARELGRREVSRVREERRPIGVSPRGPCRARPPRPC